MQNEAKLVLFIGAPSTGKTSVLKHLSKKGYQCFEEISREIVKEARKEGITHLFKEQPLLFSEKLLEKRKTQFQLAKRSKANFVFIDRGLPDITAYLDMVNTPYSKEFKVANTTYKYDKVFWFPLWNDIYIEDHERYEDFQLAKIIQKHLIDTYSAIDYELIEVPKLNIEDRVSFILSHLKNS
jgi:predicted ATPase